MDECFFKCGLTDKPMSSAGPDRIRTIIESSKKRSDTLHVSLQKKIDDDSNLTIKCHRSCVSSYTSSSHISRSLKRQGQPSGRSASLPSPTKRTRRSELPPFVFQENCIFCGEICDIKPDTKNPKRWRKSKLCRTADRPGKKSFKEVILTVCDQRKDVWAKQVQIRMQGAVSDLHAADARYHEDCRTNFMAPHSVDIASQQKPHTSDADPAFERTIMTMESDMTCIWTSVDIHNVYLENGGTTLSRHALVNKLSDHFDTELLVLCAKGIASILLFRSRAADLVKIVDDQEEEVSINRVAKSIISEVKQLPFEKHTYKTRVDKNIASEDVSLTLASLLSNISPKLDGTLPGLLIGNMITSIITNRPTSLQITLGVLVREKNLIQQLYDFGVTCSYFEVLRFKSSAAAATNRYREFKGVLDSEHGLIQAVADNFDANISSQNGLKSTNALALLLTQPESNFEAYSDKAVDTIRRISKEEMKSEVTKDITVQHYNGPKKPEMPQCESKHKVLPLKVLVQQNISLRRANNIDFDFFQNVTTTASPPEFSGFNTKLSREQGHAIKPATKTIYTPLIDMVPSDRTTMITAMIEAQNLSLQSRQNFTLFTADQQLYRVMVNVMWVYPERFMNFIPRLGGMHMLMSFIGCVGALMTNSGLEEVMKTAFGGVGRMLTGKKFPQNFRALRIVTEELLHNTVQGVDSYEDMMLFLEGRALRSRTTKLWVENVIKPVLIMMLFVRAEREADWPLHLWAVGAMMPYFFAAGHVNYARYGLYYLRSMEGLPKDILARFLNGEHVMRHRPGIWNAMWSDMFIETTFMRYGHGPGGLIGITLNPSALKRWALSLHTCSALLKDLNDMRDVNPASEQALTHKEEMPARKDSDAKDRDKIRKKLEACTDPLNPEDHPSGIFNIISGRISPEAVNADKSVLIGAKQMVEYEATWPEGFHGPLTSKVVTMSADRKRVKVGTGTTYDTEIIYARALGTMNSRTINIENIFHHELSPIPTSMFEEDGNMRITKTKSALKRKLQVEQSTRTLEQPDTVIIDGCAVLWTIHWPSQGTVQDYVNGFVGYILGKLSQCNVYLIFDRYFDYSIKSGTRASRAVEQASRHHRLKADTPLPPQHVILTVTHNKTQIIDIICQQLIERVGNLQMTDSVEFKLVVTGANPVPTEVDKGVHIQRNDMRTSHEEADVIIVQQMVHAAQQGSHCIKVISDDTDVFVLLVHHYTMSTITSKVLMEGTSSQRSVIDIGATAKKHENIVPQLLAAHALTGCDTVAYMFGVGKVTVIKVLLKGQRLDKLGVLEESMLDIVAEATKFVAACYGSKGKETMSDVRFEQWLAKTANRKVTTAPKLKSLPPTTEAFSANVMRAHLQTCIWKAATDQDPPNMDPTNFGWTKDESTKSLLPIALPPDVEPAPGEVLQMIQCGCSTDTPCSTARCSCSSARLPCTAFCRCHGTELCGNMWTKHAAAQSDNENEEVDEVTDTND